MTPARAASPWLLLRPTVSLCQDPKAKEEIRGLRARGNQEIMESQDYQVCWDLLVPKEGREKLEQRELASQGHKAKRDRGA